MGAIPPCCVVDPPQKIADEHRNPMRILSYILFAAAAFVASCAVLAYLYLTSLACGYAPGASACHASLWELGSDDRLFLVELPGCIVAILIACAILARRKAR